jgi:hypothetical protein
MLARSTFALARGAQRRAFHASRAVCADEEIPTKLTLNFSM